MNVSKGEVLIEAKDLKKYYRVKKGLGKVVVKAVDGVNLSIYKGEALGLVGESGCGKSTFGRALIRLDDPTDGSILYDGQNLMTLSHKEMKKYRQDLQIIFQDPSASLNPRKTIFDSVRLPLRVHAELSEEEQLKRTAEMLRYVELQEDNWYRYPHELSGGQKQRAVIARALIVHPKFFVGDEPVSALDVSIQSQILNLLKRILRDEQLSLLFISHNLSVVRFLCDRIAVMYLGRILEIGSKEEIFGDPAHPYTRALMSAIPIPDVHARKKRVVLSGDVPSPSAPPSGCPFHTRCPYAVEQCSVKKPELHCIGGTHFAACDRLTSIREENHG